MKKEKILITTLVTALTFGVISQAGAWMGGMGGPMTGTNRPTITAEQEKKAREIELKYQKQLADKESALRVKAAELETALADGSTTVNKANTLRSELYALEQDYWRLRSQVNQEIGTGYSGPMGWGCSWHDNHPGMYGGYGTMMGPGAMMMGNNGGWCRW